MIFKILIDDIIVPEGRRALDHDEVAQLAESLRTLGQLHPILVRQDGQTLRLVAGNHRLAAARSLGWGEIEAVFLDGDDAQMRRVEIAENLHRNELTALERDELLAEWIRLTDKEDQKPSQPETVSKGGRGKEGGVNAAARELGVSKADAHRAVKVANLSPEAKEVARTAGLDDNRSALLEAAKEFDAQEQVNALKERMAKQKEERAAKRREEKRRPRVNEIIHAWIHATQKQRRDFALSYRTEIMRAQQSAGLAGPAADHAEAVRLAADRAEDRSQSTATTDDGLDIPVEFRRAQP